MINYETLGRLDTKQTKPGLKEKLTEYSQKFKQLIRDTQIEIGLGVVAGALIGLTLASNNEIKRGETIPLGFSEITQIERDGERLNKRVGPITKYLASANDAVMKVFESYNDANANSWSKNRFAFELEAHYDPTMNHHTYSLDQLLEMLPKLADTILTELPQMKQIRNEIKSPNKHFDNSWADSHHDHYRTEVYLDTETSTDSEGNSHTKTVTKTREVYDHTTHTYNYNNNEGEIASKTIDAFLKKHPTINFNEELNIAKQTNAEGEYAAEKSRKIRDQRLKASELRKIANTWNYGSTFKKNMSAIIRAHSSLPSLANQWRTAKSTAKSDSYNTSSKSDNGPLEFQIAENTLSTGKIIERKTSEIIEGIEYTKTMAPILKEKIHRYVRVISDGKKGNASQLKKEIMAMSKEIYKRNFTEGFEVDRLRPGIIVLGLLLGGLIGGLVGYGVDKVGNRYWTREENSFKYRFKDRSY